MMKKLLPFVFLPLLLAGCATTVTNLTPLQQPRSPDNLYRVAASFTSRQQSLRWETIQPQVIVGSKVLPMQATPLMQNRWEAFIPVPAGVNEVKYQYKFDFECNAFGPKQASGFNSQVYTLKIVN